MPNFEPRDSDFEVRIRESFARQEMMRVLGAALVAVRPGEVEIALPFRADLTQQHGYLHAAAVTAIADSACGYAALTLMAPGREVLSVEFKVNLLAPAAGERFLALGRVVRAGRTLTVCTAEVHAEQGGVIKLVAMMQATLIAAGVPGRRAAEP
ncbi:MAG TPA: PaaI family thioesterase [Thermoanaerobaculia bacterium]|nr:PaaI family thioesterase [Thermoanaerobaculia bacterium]